MEATSANCRIWYESVGHGAPVLFIQGVGVCGQGWRPQTEALSSYYECAWFDHRGMGRSETGDNPITVDVLAADTLAVMDAKGWPSAHLVGHSLGGLIALRTALQAKHRVRSLSLLCTFADGAEPTRLSWPLLHIGIRTRLGSMASRRRAFLQLLLTPQAHQSCDHARLASQLAPLFGHDLGTQPPVAMRQLFAMKGYSLTARLAALHAVPTLVVGAKHDLIARPTAGQALAAAIPNARYIEIEDAAHGLPLTHPALTNSLLRQHIDAAELTSP